MALTLALLVLGWWYSQWAPGVTVLCGAAALFMGVVACLAYMHIDLERYDLARVVVAQGLETDDIVVTAGVQALRPGQQVRILGAAAQGATP